jgi:hypothetical protein
VNHHATYPTEAQRRAYAEAAQDIPWRSPVTWGAAFIAFLAGAYLPWERLL